MITRDFKSQKLPAKNAFLNPHQKSELKKMLTERYTQMFKDGSPAAIADEIEKFFASGLPINSRTLSELEHQVRRAVIRTRTNPKQASSQKLTVQDQNKNSQSFNEQQAQSVNCPISAPGKSQKDDEDDEADWDTLGAYQTYILKQEKELERKRKALEQKSLGIQLAKQVDEKRQRDALKKAEHESYVNVETLQLNQHHQQCEENERRRTDEKRYLFDMQQKMIQERQAQLAREKQTDETIDRRIKECIEQDLVRQKELQLNQAASRKAEMNRVRKENELRKQQKKEQEDRDRCEEIELQQLSDKLGQELEQKRAAELQNKADKIQQMIIAGEQVVRGQRDRNAEEERKLNEYLEKKNRAMDRKETRLREKEKENKANYKRFLEQQMEEQRAREHSEKEFMREQADIWRQENEFYSKVKEEQTVKQATENQGYRDVLQRQIQEKGERRKPLEMPDSETMKKKLLEEIQTLDVQNRILNEQLQGL